MGWSTNLFCNINFHKKTYNSIYEVESEIEFLEKCIETCKNEIQNLVMITEPKKFCEEDQDPMGWMIGIYRDDMELLEEYTIELYKLRLLYNNWDKCHDDKGLAINLPENIHYDSAFLDGNFIKTIKHPE